ncbi:MAG: hypothetical protein ACOX8U_01435 [Bradymonadia bacterium]|jgi:hypothetical protein
MRGIFVTLLLILLLSASCSTKAIQAKDASQVAEPKIEVTASSEQSAPLDEANDLSLAPEAKVNLVDFSTLGPSNVTAFEHGNSAFELSDILPMLSEINGYHQKWEFYNYTRPYQIRLRFEISSLAFSTNEGKVAGYINRYEGEELVEEIKISEKLRPGEWKANKERLELQFGEDYSLRYENNRFYLKGKTEDIAFELELAMNFWKPGSGAVYFGNSTEKYYKYSILCNHYPIIRGKVQHHSQSYELSGHTYANHFATNIPVYEMAAELQDYRKVQDGLIVEYRYFVPAKQFEQRPFGFAFVAFEGDTVFESTQLERRILETWLDDDHYGYTVPIRQIISANQGDANFEFKVLQAIPEPNDPYKGLPTFQRNIATRVAKPMSYSISSDFELKLHKDAMRARIPLRGTFSVTLFE